MSSAIYNLVEARPQQENFDILGDNPSVLFVSRGGDIGRIILMLSIYLLLNFRNLRRTISKLSGLESEGLLQAGQV